MKSLVRKSVSRITSGTRIASRGHIASAERVAPAGLIVWGRRIAPGRRIVSSQRISGGRIAATLSAAAVGVWCLAGVAAAAQFAACGHGTECTATVAQDTPGTQDYEAFVGDDAAGAGQPGFVLPSNEVLVTCWRFISHGPPGSLASGLQGCAAFTSGGRLDMCGMQPRKTLIA
jgi:hypothetical protein